MDLGVADATPGRPSQGHPVTTLPESFHYPPISREESSLLLILLYHDLDHALYYYLDHYHTVKLYWHYTVTLIIIINYHLLDSKYREE